MTTKKRPAKKVAAPAIVEESSVSTEAPTVAPEAPERPVTDESVEPTEPYDAPEPGPERPVTEGEAHPTLIACARCDRPRTYETDGLSSQSVAYCDIHRPANVTQEMVDAFQATL